MTSSNESVVMIQLLIIAGYTNPVLYIIRIYIYCEQNDPCSGCTNRLIVGVCLCAVSAFQTGIAERSAAFSCCMGS